MIFSNRMLTEMNPSSNITLIEASAGTGKTYHITQECVRRLASGQKIEQVMVVTFTEKAARDMKGRIRQGIEEALFKQELNDIELDRLRDSLSRFDEAAIGTIHSIAHRLLQEHTVEHGLSISTELSHSDSELCDELVESTLLRILGEDQDSSWHRLISRTYLSEIKDALRGLIQELISNLVELEDGYDLSQLNAHLVLDHDVRELTNLQSDDDERALFCKHFDQGWRYLYDLLHDPYVLNDKNCYTKGAMETLTSLLEWKLDSDSNVNIFKTGKNKPSYYEELNLRSREILDIFSLAFIKETNDWSCKETNFKSIIKLWSAKFKERLLKNNIFNSKLTLKLIEQIRVRKSQINTLSFDELLVLFAEASHKASFQSSLRSRYTFVCIDEFQDTNFLQWSAFKALFDHDGCDVLLVGDPKQAIYSFRGGDIHAYEEAAAEVTKGKSLDANFRSTPPLISGLNRLFNEQRMTSPDPLEPYEIEIPTVRYPVDQKFKKSTPTLSGQMNLKAINPPAGSLGSSGYIKAGWLRMNMGHYIAQNILDFLQREQRRGEQTRLSDCAILVNTNREARMIQRTLSRWGIKSALVVDESIYATQTAQYLILWLDALLNLEDEGKVVGALSTPFFGHTHDDALKHARSEQGYTDRSALERQSDKWLERLHALTLIKYYERATDNPSGISKHLEQLLKRPQGHEMMLQLQHLLSLLYQKSDSDYLSPSAQLHYLKKMCAQRLAEDPNQDEVVEEEKISYQIEPDVAQIVTIHKSKGLEFKAVFCATLWNKMFDDSSKLMVRAGRPVVEAFEDQDDFSHCQDSILHAEKVVQSSTRLLIRSNKNQLKDQIQFENNKEKIRKLYVAFTRASRELFLYFGLANEHLDHNNNMTYPLIGYQSKRGSKDPDCTNTTCKDQKTCVPCDHISLRTYVQALSQALNISDQAELSNSKMLRFSEKQDQTSLTAQIFESMRDSVTYETLHVPPKPTPEQTKTLLSQLFAGSDQGALNQPKGELSPHNTAWRKWSYSTIFHKGGKLTQDSIESLSSSHSARAPREDDESDDSTRPQTTQDQVSTLINKRAGTALLLEAKHANLPAPLLSNTYLPRWLRANKLGTFIHELFELWDLEAKRLDCLHGEQGRWVRLNWDQVTEPIPEGMPLLKWVALCRATILICQREHFWTHTGPSELNQALKENQSLLDFFSVIQSRALARTRALEISPPTEPLLYNPMESAEDEAYLFTQLLRDMIAMSLTPLGGPMKTSTLASLKPFDVLHELEFDFAIGKGLSERDSLEVWKIFQGFSEDAENNRYLKNLLDTQAHIIGSADSSHEPKGQRVDEHEETTQTEHKKDKGHQAPKRRVTQLSGMMNGSIDLVFRKKITRKLNEEQSETASELENRYFIADYKTNWITIGNQEDQEDLNDTQKVLAYEPHYLGVQMLPSHYHLQGHIYLVALHRYLQGKLGAEYCYDKHIGGYYYLYCRGMIGPEASIISPLHTSTHFSAEHKGSLGVYYYRPPKARIEALSRTFQRLKGDQ